MWYQLSLWRGWKTKIQKSVAKIEIKGTISQTANLRKTSDTAINSGLFQNHLRFNNLLDSQNSLKVSILTVIFITGKIYKLESSKKRDVKRKVLMVTCAKFLLYQAWGNTHEVLSTQRAHTSFSSQNFYWYFTARVNDWFIDLPKWLNSIYFPPFPSSKSDKYIA